MNRPSSLQLIGFLIASLTIQTIGRAQIVAPPEPAPKAGMPVELFDTVTLANRPTANEAVFGWYAMLGFDGTGSSERPPRTFESVDGSLLVVSHTEGGQYPYDDGRARQVPGDTILACVDVFVPTPTSGNFGIVGLRANTQEFGAQYGIDLAFTLPAPSSEPEEGAQEIPAPVIWSALFHGLQDLPHIFDDLDFNEWIRLEIALNLASSTVTYRVNGEVIASGVVPQVRSLQAPKDLPDPGPIDPISELALVVGNRSAFTPGPSEEEDVEETAALDLSTLAFFDNLSFSNGLVPTARPRSAKPDLTLGPNLRQARSVGNNVYSGDPRRQLQASTLPATGNGRIFYGIENDGNAAGVFHVKGTNVGNRNVIIENYLLDGNIRRRVTGAVLTGRLAGTVPPGGRIFLTAEARLLPAFASRFRVTRGQSVAAAQGLILFLNPRILDTGTAGFEFNSGVPLTR